MIRALVLILGLLAGQASADALGPLHTPERGTAEREGIMDAARVPIGGEIGVPVIFVVDVLQSDGHWAYLEGTPVNPDGTDINWANTVLADAMAQGMMSRTAMVLLRNDGQGWGVADYVMGPTDVYWLGWVDSFGLPERLFRP
jgi:hypothetical protein